MITQTTHRSGFGQNGAAGALKRWGLRPTPQRLLILAAIERQKGHFCAEDVLSLVQPSYPSLSPSTIYRTLDLLDRVGLIVKSDLGGDREEYHWAEKGRHHHLICQGCGATLELEERVVDSFKEKLQEVYGFRPDLSHMAIFGLCARCSKKKAQAGRAG